VMRGFSQTCFVIMPFRPELNSMYERAIKPAVSESGFVALRTDDFVQAGDVTAAIHDGIRNCAFVIADLTWFRPNVMYEIGLAHAFGKPVVLLLKDDSVEQPEDIPFDLATHQVFRYRTDDGGVADCRLLLERLIGELSPQRVGPTG
jgi:nucleoside 2-deoxyribosyltransferase